MSCQRGPCCRPSSMSSPHSDPPGTGLKDVLLRSSEPDSNLCVAFCLHPASHQSDVPAPPGPRRPYNDWHSQWKRLPELLLLLVEDLAEVPASAWRVCRKEQRGGWHQGCRPSFRRQLGLWHGVEAAAGESTPAESAEPKHLKPSQLLEQRMSEEYTKRLDTCTF